MHVSGSQAGEIEELTPLKTENGLGVSVKDFSPFAITWRELGDINCDGSVDLGDLLRLLKYLNGAVSSVPGNPDVNGDDRDAGAARRTKADWNREPAGDPSDRAFAYGHTCRWAAVLLRVERDWG